MPQQNFVGNNCNQASQRQQGFYLNQYQNSQQPTQSNYSIPNQQGPFNNMDKLSYDRDEYQKLVMFYILSSCKIKLVNLIFFIDTL